MVPLEEPVVKCLAKGYNHYRAVCDHTYHFHPYFGFVPVFVLAAQGLNCEEPNIGPHFPIVAIFRVHFFRFFRFLTFCCTEIMHSLVICLTAPLHCLMCIYALYHGNIIVKVYGSQFLCTLITICIIVILIQSSCINCGYCSITMVQLQLL